MIGSEIGQCKYLYVNSWHTLFIVISTYDFSSQIHTGLKKKTFEAAGIPVTHSGPVQPQPTVLVVQQPTLINTKSTAEVTLNMLNAPESEVDVEGLNFDSANEVVAS